MSTVAACLSDMRYVGLGECVPGVEILCVVCLSASDVRATEDTISRPKVTHMTDRQCVLSKICYQNILPDAANIAVASVKAATPGPSSRPVHTALQDGQRFSRRLDGRQTTNRVVCRGITQ